MKRLSCLLMLSSPLLSESFSAYSSFVARPDVSLGTAPGSSRMLSMHMGHSHSHHHHGHAHHHAAATPLQRPITVRRKVSLVVFAACVVLLPQYVLKKSITRAHGATFVLTCIALSMLNEIRSGFMGFVEKFKVCTEICYEYHCLCVSLSDLCLFSPRIQRFRTRMAMHTPRTKLLDYLLRNQNPADRVTMVGVVINLILSVSKFSVGVACHSSALVADAGHSLSDLFSDFVTLYSVQLARLREYYFVNEHCYHFRNFFHFLMKCI